MQPLIAEILSCLKQGQDLVMATILSKQGSAPRSAGTRMVVYPDGRISGTIGGGWVEAEIQKKAKALFEQAGANANASAGAGADAGAGAGADAGADADADAGAGADASAGAGAGADADASASADDGAGADAGDTVQDTASIRRFVLDSKIYAEMDMVCGGNVSILTEYVAANQENIVLFSRLLDHLKARQACFLVNRLDKGVDNDSEAGFLLQRCVISGIGKGEIASQHGSLVLTDSALEEIVQESKKMRSPGLIEVAGKTYFIEPARFDGILYLCGAGHLGVETAALAHNVGFRTVVLDDRAEFANAERFPHAEVHVVDDLSRCFDGFDIGPDSFISIMTRGHLFDRQILEEALKTEATYIGMIGSSSKREAIYAYLMEAGVSQERLNEIHSPIGLSIGAQTPEEIAVSIVAELIQVRFKGKA